AGRPMGDSKNTRGVQNLWRMNESGSGPDRRESGHHLAGGHEARDASRVISGTPANALLTGQPALAALACSMNAASSSPGTRPVVTRAILVIVGRPSTGLSVTVASVCTESGGLPA